MGTFCRHFTGLQHDTCEAGHAYLDVADPPTNADDPRFGIYRRVPCYRDRDGIGCCPDRAFPTAEEEAEEEARIARFLVDMITVREAIVGKIGPWKRGQGSQGTLDCTVCGTGTVRFTRSSYNGHIHAACSTEGCISWME